MSITPHTTAVDDIVVLDSPAQPVDHTSRQTSQDVILLDESPSPHRQASSPDAILVDERPRKRRRRDVNTPQPTPIDRPESGPSNSTASVIVVDDDDSIQPNTFHQPNPQEDTVQPNTTPQEFHTPSIINPTNSNANLSPPHNQPNRFVPTRDHFELLSPNTNENDIIEMAAAGPRVLSAAASASTPSAPRMTTAQPRASSSAAPMTFPSPSTSEPTPNPHNNQNSRSRTTSFAHLLAAANAAGRSASQDQNNAQRNSSANRNPASMPSLLAFREDQSHRSLHMIRSRAIRSRAIQRAQAMNRNNRTRSAPQTVQFMPSASRPSASQPFVSAASGTTPSPSISIPTNEMGPSNDNRQSTQNIRATAHVPNQRSGTGAVFVTLPQPSSSQRNNQSNTSIPIQSSSSIPILNLHTGEILQHGNASSNQQQASGSNSNQLSSLHFIVAPPNMNFSVAPSGASSIGSIDTGDSQSTTLGQIRRRSTRRGQSASAFLTIRSSHTRRTDNSNPRNHTTASDTQTAGNGANGHGSSTVTSFGYATAVVGIEHTSGRSSTGASNRQRGGIRHRGRHLIQFMNTNGLGTPFEIQYIQGLAGDQELDYEQLIRLDEELVREKNRADKDQINALPIVKATAADSDIRCCICMCDVEEGDELRVLPCSHKYHKDCIDEWLTYNGCCPVDKKRIAPKARRRGSGHRS